MKHTIILRITALAMAASLTPTYAEQKSQQDYFDAELMKLYIKKINEYLKEIRPNLDFSSSILTFTKLTYDNIPELEKNIDSMEYLERTFYQWADDSKHALWRLKDRIEKEADEERNARERARKEKEAREAREAQALLALERKKAEEAAKAAAEKQAEEAKKAKEEKKILNRIKKKFTQKK